MTLLEPCGERAAPCCGRVRGACFKVAGSSNQMPGRRQTSHQDATVGSNASAVFVWIRECIRQRSRATAAGRHPNLVSCSVGNLVSLSYRAGSSRTTSWRPLSRLHKARVKAVVLLLPNAQWDGAALARWERCFMIERESLRSRSV